MRLQWLDTPPEPGTVVGMGRDRRWQIAHVQIFKPTVPGPITDASLCLVQLPEQPMAREDWDCWEFRDEDSHEAFYVHLEAVGRPELEIGIDYTEETPWIGKQLFDAVPVGDGTRLAAVRRPWVIESTVSYFPVGKGSPYDAIYVSWCKALVEQFQKV